MKIGIMTAMSSEFEQLAKNLNNKKESTVGPFCYIGGEAGGNEIVLLQCGIGKVNAAAGALELIHTFSPDAIISTGVAGGIDAQIGVMDVVVSREIAYHDVWCGMGNVLGQIQGMPPRFAANERLLQCALSLDTETRIHAGLICCGDQFITDRKELDVIKSNFPEGLAVDMESASIAQVCHLYGIAFLSFRIISDTPGVKDHVEQYENFWGEIANRSFGVTQSFLHALPNSIDEL